MGKGHIIWLNGVSSSGKSSLTKELQKILPKPYFCIGQDIFTDIIAPCFSGYFNGIDSNSLWYVAVDAMYHTIKTYSDMGLNVIVDHVVLNQGDGKEQNLFDSCINELKFYPITFVKVVCSLDELKRREISRGDRDIGNAEWQVKQGLYPLDNYDIIVDTGVMPLGECAKNIYNIIKYSETTSICL
jgi:chloramphenicol 3-O phosphotransferase